MHAKSYVVLVFFACPPAKSDRALSQVQQTTSQLTIRIRIVSKAIPGVLVLLVPCGSATPLPSVV